MALPLYALTLFVSAFILFLVQPIVGKIILPKLGGTPQVWNTCMVFFQMVLLAGYAYTHNASTRLTLRQQLMAHIVLLALPLALLLPFPFAFGGAGPEYAETGVISNPNSLWGFLPDLGSNPIPSTLSILFLYVALPFLVVATTAPLLQKWFVHTGHPASKDPYFLYGASNLGSMLSLIVYPILIEPNLKLSEQGWTYTAGYLALAALVLACAAMVWNSKDISAAKPRPEPVPPPPVGDAPVPAPSTATSVKPGQPKFAKGAPGKPISAADGPISIASDDITGWRRFRWVLLAAIPSSLMLGITTHITTDLSPMPLFWLVPLILYLGSFILVFMRWPFNWLEKAHVYFLFGQPICVALMIMVDVLSLTNSTEFLVFAIFCHVLGFFTTTMVCHGELAKDRPSTKHLTEFYLWMSVGGMVGGMFNALIAPVIFKKLWELPIAIFGAVIVRPKMFETGFLDNFIANLLEGKAEAPAPKPGHKGAKGPVQVARTGEANESLVQTLDWVWPIGILLLTGVLLLVLSTAPSDNSQVAADRARRNMAIDFAIPLIIACVCMTRPIRVGLGIGFILLVFTVHQYMGDRSIYSTRSYFGAMSVKQYDDTRKGFKYRQLIHGHIDHGMNFLPPDKAENRGDPLKDWSRLATTYYHREGPAGRVMEKYNWFPGPPDSNTYWADARMPTNLLTGLFADIGSGSSSLPITGLVASWSEPPIATVGLGTGTMASYGRPYQHVHFYEIDNEVLRFSLASPTREIKGNFEKDTTPHQEYAKVRAGARRETYFNYLEQAIERGSTVQVLMGDARLRMALDYENHYETFIKGKPDNGGGPKNFYHMMVVDAFSSDAIPAHLLTVEAFQMYFNRLAPEGILCVHTSNRFVDLPKVVAAISNKLGYAHRRGHDSAQRPEDRENGHYTSEWVMVAREDAHLRHLSKDVEFLARYEKNSPRGKKGRPTDEDYWQSVNTNPRYAWTDDYYNLLSVVRFFNPRGGVD